MRAQDRERPAGRAGVVDQDELLSVILVADTLKDNGVTAKAVLVKTGIWITGLETEMVI